MFLAAHWMSILWCTRVPLWMTYCGSVCGGVATREMFHVDVCDEALQFQGLQAGYVKYILPVGRTNRTATDSE